MLTEYNLGSEVAVVLGGGISSDGVPSRETVKRAEAGIKLAKERPDVTFFLSGYTPHGEGKVTEAAAMSQLFEAAGIPRKRLLLEDESRDTIGNAILIASRFLRGATPRKFYVVTSPFHAARALGYFRGVYPAAWDLEIVRAEALDDDDARALNEPGGIEWGKKFFSGIEPGDIDALIRRLQEQRPAYRNIAWLTA
jgi:hypothetical protein